MGSSLSQLINHQVRLASRPVGLARAENWQFTTEPVNEPVDGAVLVKALALSLDPAMRGWLNDGKSYIPPVGIGEVMRAGGIGRVVASKDPAFQPGDVVSGLLGVQEYSQAAAGLPGGRLQKIDLRLGTPAQWLNVYGMPGMTAYFGLKDVGLPQAGQTLVVSGAAGAVGQTVGQLARIWGMRAVGIAGGQAKCDWVVRELGFDACIDYKACFRINTRKMERHRALTIFASAIPLDEWLNKNPDISWNKDKICWNTELKDAFGVSFSNEELEDAKIRSLTTYRMNGSRPQPILRPNEEIELKFTTEAESTDSGSIVLPADRYLPYTILASISDKDPPDAPRRQLGTRQFRHLLLLTGKDAYGNYHTRTWYVPLRVRIDTDFEHYKWFYLLLAVVGVVALAAGIHWLCKTKGTVAPIAETQLAVTAADDFFSDSPAATIQSKTSSATTSPSKIAKPPVKPQEASEPPAVKPTDDWENW